MRMRTGKMATIVLPTYPQYVKVCLGLEGMCLFHGLTLVNVLVQVGYHVPETLFLLAMLALLIVGVIWCFPTRKKYDKLVSIGSKE